MHVIQKKIIEKLYYAKKRRYSQLKPDNIESNLFQYHLNKLKKDKLITKKNDFYVLTTEGQSYADRLSTTNFEPRKQAKIVTVISVINGEGDELLYERKHQPYLGYISLTSGKTHLGEKISESAHRELMDKIGFHVDLKHVGEVYVTIRNKEGIISSILGHVFHGETDKKSQKFPDISSKGRRMWGKPEEIAKNHKFVPGTFELRQLIKENPDGFFFKEMDYTID